MLNSKARVPRLESATRDADTPARRLLLGSARDRWLGTAYEMKHLMRIRPHADGFRQVNVGKRFVAISSPESSEFEEEKSAAKSNDKLLPVFFRNDRVLFKAKRRWLRGTVRRRIATSNFYCIRTDTGNLFDAVLASKIELLDEEEMPYYHFTRGDRVLWVPNADEETRWKRRQSNKHDKELTYKAKIIRVCSLDRFDLVLRTSRVVKKVSYEQIRPCAESDQVTPTT